jgi:hypothetical protein
MVWSAATPREVKAKGGTKDVTVATVAASTVKQQELDNFIVGNTAERKGCCFDCEMQVITMTFTRIKQKEIPKSTVMM